LFLPVQYRPTKTRFAFACSLTQKQTIKIIHVSQESDMAYLLYNITTLQYTKVFRKLKIFRYNRPQVDGL
jgi:hypothetical protein